MSLICVQLKENGLNLQLCDLKFSFYFGNIYYIYIYKITFYSLGEKK